MADTEAKRAIEHMRETYRGATMEPERGWIEAFERQEAALAEIAALHRPFGVYDECHHDHAEDDPKRMVVGEDCFVTCEEFNLYDICCACCTDGDGHQTEECLSHDHGPGKPICATAAAIPERVKAGGK